MQKKQLILGGIALAAVLFFAILNGPAIWQLFSKSKGLVIIDIAPTPASGIIHTANQNVPLLGLSLRSTGEQAFLKSIIFTGYVDNDIDGDFFVGTHPDNTRLLIANMVDTLALYDQNGILLSGISNFDSTGKLKFNSMRIPIPKGKILNLMLRGNVSTTAPMGFENRIKIGLASNSDINVQNAVYDPTGVTNNAKNEGTADAGIIMNIAP